MYLFKDEYDKSFNEASKKEIDPGFNIQGRANKRKIDFLKDTYTFIENEEQYLDIIHSKK